MKIKLISDIAFNLLKARLKQSVIAAMGVTFGISMFITLVGFMNGLNQLLDGLMLNRTPHVRLYNEVKPLNHQPITREDKMKNHAHFIHSIKPRDRGKEIYNSKEIIKTLKKDVRIIDVAPKVSTQVFFNIGSIQLGGVINGIDIVAEEKLFAVSEYVISGKIENLATQNNSIAIGKGLAQKLQVKVGDIVKISTPQGELIALKVVAIMQIGIAEIDDTMTYTSLETAQKVLGKPASYITDIQVKLFDINTAPALAQEFKNVFEIDAIDVQTANSQFETGSKVRTIISYSVSITLLIVAGFGIYNILNMLIYEKMDTIAILKATGFSGNDVKWIFVFLAWIIGISGGSLGLIFGFIFTTIVDNIPFETAALPTIKTYPIDYNIAYYFIGITFALITTTAAGLLPALKASKIDPVEIIRGK